MTFAKRRVSYDSAPFEIAAPLAILAPQCLSLKSPSTLPRPSDRPSRTAHLTTSTSSPARPSTSRSERARSRASSSPSPSTSEFEQTREISDVIDPRPLLSSENIALARWLSEYYLAPLFDCISLMLPPGFRRKPLIMLRPLASIAEIPTLRLTDLQAAVLRRAIELGEVDADELKREVKLPGAPGAITALIRRGFLQRSYQLARPQIAPKVVRQVRLDAPEANVRPASRSCGRTVRRARCGGRCC